MRNQEKDVDFVFNQLNSRNNKLFYLIIIVLSIIICVGSIIIFKGYRKIQAKITSFATEINLKNQEISRLNGALKNLNEDKNKLTEALEKTKQNLLELYHTDRDNVSKRLKKLEDFQSKTVTQITSIDRSLQGVIENKMDRSDGDKYYIRTEVDRLMIGKLDVQIFNEFGRSLENNLANYATTNSLSLYAKGSDLANYVKQPEFNSFKTELQGQLNLRVTLRELESKLATFYTKPQVEERFVKKTNEEK